MMNRSCCTFLISHSVFQTLTLITNYTDLVTMVMNDTLNVLNVTSNKTLVGIMNMYLEKVNICEIVSSSMIVELISNNNIDTYHNTSKKKVPNQLRRL